MKNNIFHHDNLFSEIWCQSRTVVATIHITYMEFCNQFVSPGASVLQDDIRCCSVLVAILLAKEPFQSPYSPLTVLLKKKAIMRLYRLNRFSHPRHPRQI